MTQRERIRAVYQGKTPDVVPFMLDLSHWFYHRTGRPWDLSVAYDTPERELVEYHKQCGAGFYIPNLGSFYSVTYPEDVKAQCTKRMVGGAPEIVWRYETPLGTIERARRWEPPTYAWGISHWGVSTERDLEVLTYALAGRRYAFMPDRYRAWEECVGEIGVVYVGAGYSAMGQLLNYWMGVEQTMYAVADFPDKVMECMEAVNRNQMELVDVLAASPAEFIEMGDNFSSDLQPPRFFEKWSRPYYAEAVRRLHAAGKYVAVHIDGRLRGAIAMIRDAGADCADAVTPAPMGDMTPGECRREAGPEFILSGGVPPDLWLPRVPVETFRAAVLSWLELRKESPRLIAAAGDQVPPGADESRTTVMRYMVEEYGRY